MHQDWAPVKPKGSHECRVFSLIHQMHFFLSWQRLFSVEVLWSSALTAVKSPWSKNAISVQLFSVLSSGRFQLEKNSSTSGTLTSSSMSLHSLSRANRKQEEEGLMISTLSAMVEEKLILALMIQHWEVTMINSWNKCDKSSQCRIAKVLDVFFVTWQQ